MNRSDETSELFTALAAAQGEIENPTKEREADTGKFSYMYADIADVTSLVRPVLAKHGLSFVQATQLDGSAMMLETVIAHKSGQWMSSLYPVCTMGPNHQAMGGAMSYARRYSLCSMLGIAADEDTDAKAATGMDTDTLPKPQRTNQNPHAIPPAGKRKSASQAKKDGDWERLEKMIDTAETLDALRKTWREIQAELVQLPAGWKESFDDRMLARKDELAALDEDNALNAYHTLRDAAETFCATPDMVDEFAAINKAEIEALPSDKRIDLENELEALRDRVGAVAAE